jgi:hypothetical protein
MPVTKRLTIETVDLDDEDEMDEFDRQIISAGLARVRAESAELIRRGLMDEEGNMLTSELPPDMRPGSERDFGG